MTGDSIEMLEGQAFPLAIAASSGRDGHPGLIAEIGFRPGAGLRM